MLKDKLIQAASKTMLARADAKRSMTKYPDVCELVIKHCKITGSAIMLGDEKIGQVYPNGLSYMSKEGYKKLKELDEALGIEIDALEAIDD